MKNLFIALFMFAGTMVTAQTSQADLQKELGITEVQAEQVAMIKTKYCTGESGCKLPEGMSKADMSDEEYRAAMAETQNQYYAALTEVIPEDKAKLLLADCKKQCDMGMAKATSTKARKSCCASKSKKSCHDKKKADVQ